MENSKPFTMPVDVGLKLVKAVDDNKKINQAKYQSAVGSLLYLSTRTN